jgi:predicted acetyltransferase
VTGQRGQGAGAPVEPVVLRALREADEAAVRDAQAELAGEGFPFVFWDEGATWQEVLERVAAERQGVSLPPGRVPATFLVAVRGDQIVGRTSIRHRLNEYLTNVGGHIGFGVRPSWRRRGVATSILRQSLQVTDRLGVRRVLLTCRIDNTGSARVIESLGGVLDDIREDGSGTAVRRYWINRSNHTSLQ